MRLAILGLVIAAAGCGVFGNTCDHPDEQELTCQPLPAGSTEPGCMGRPPQDVGEEATHTDERYPVGCRLTYPACLGAYPDSPQQCFCSDPGGNGAAMWSCPV